MTKVERIIRYFSAETAALQKYNLPNPIILYFFKSSIISPDLYYKLYSCCKNLFLKSKIIPFILVHLLPSEAIFKYKSKETKCLQSYFDNTHIKFRIFDTRDFIFPFYDWLLPKIWRYEPSLVFILGNTKMRIEELRKIVYYAKKVIICRGSEDHPFGVDACVEKILECMPNARVIYLQFIQNKFPEKSAEKIANLKRFTKIEFFQIEIIPKTFNASAFANFIKKNSSVNGKFVFLCDPSFSEEQIQNFKAKIEEEVLITWKPQSERPHFKMYYYADDRNTYAC